MRVSRGDTCGGEILRGFGEIEWDESAQESSGRGGVECVGAERGGKKPGLSARIFCGRRGSNWRAGGASHGGYGLRATIAGRAAANFAGAFQNND